MEITITEKAGHFIRRMIRFGGGAPGAGFRLAVKPGGCAGLTYDFTIEAGPRPGDRVVDGPGFRVFVPAESLPYLEGTTVDFSESLTYTGLVFHNPNVTAECACGTSFTVEAGASPRPRSAGCWKGHV